jgi:hypothetical protein
MLFMSFPQNIFMDTRKLGEAPDAGGAAHAPEAGEPCEAPDVGGLLMLFRIVSLTSLLKLARRTVRPMQAGIMGLLMLEGLLILLVSLFH